MRLMTYIIGVVGLLFLAVLSGRAGNDEAGVVIDKAIKAHFPKGVDTKNQGLRTKSKGALHIMGMDLDFTQEVAVQFPNKFKEAMELDVMGNKFKVTTVFNGKEGWIKANNMDVNVTKEILHELQEAMHNLAVAQGVFLKDKALKHSLLGEVQINGKLAVGVKISKDGKRDLNLYFDKKTGLMAKVERRTRDLMNNQEVTEERFIIEYKDVGGRKIAKKVEVKRDGKNFIEAEVLDVQFSERIDDSEFAKP
jgi:hypothetical protein